MLTGIIMLVLGVLKLGALLRFVPNAVMVGFINAVAVLIILGQLGDFTGYDSPASDKVMKAVNTLFNLDQIDLQTFAVGIVTILLILILANTKISKFGLIVALGAASLMVPFFNWESVAQVADIPDSLPRPMLPDLSAIGQLLVPALSLAFVGLIQGAGVSQNYVNPDGKYPDASGDFVGQGMANIAAGFFQGMPVGGSLSATSLVVNSGAKSRFANIFAGITIALLLFGGLVGKLAMPALAGLLIVIGFQTLKPDDVLMVWKTGYVQRMVIVLTFLLPSVKHVQPGAQILSRTHPNIFDLYIALVSGAAAYAMSRKGVAAALPGVAIAAALVPPLCVVGYGLGSFQWEIASSSLLLFLTNLAAIVFASSLTFLLLGFRPTRHEKAENVRRGVALAIVGLVIVVAPLALTTLRGINELNAQLTVGQVLDELLPEGYADVDDLSVEPTSDGYQIDLTLYRFDDTTDVGDLNQEIVDTLLDQLSQDSDDIYAITGGNARILGGTKAI